MFLNSSILSWLGFGLGLPGTARGQDRSADYVAQAFSAMRNADNRNAQRFLMSAVDERAATSTLGDAYASIAAELLASGHPTEAVNLIEPASKAPATSWSPLIWASLAAAYRSAGDLDRSTAAVHQAEIAAKAIENGSNPIPLSLRNARADADRCIQLGSYDVEFRKDTQGAVAQYRAALALIPDDPGVKFRLGRILAEIGTTVADFDEAVTLTAAAVAAAPTDARYLDAYGWALFKRQEFGAAEHALNLAVASAPEAAPVHYHLGKLFARLGQTNDAIREFNRALYLRPEYPEATAAISVLGLPAPQPGAFQLGPPAH